LRYEVLGHVELFGTDGPVRLGGPKQRTVLALLLVNANRVVSEQRFVSMVWGDDAPSSVRGQLQMYVSQLRKLIGEPVIIRRPPGYVIQVRPGQLDLAVFDETVRQARADREAGRVEDAAERLRSALDLWRGPALGGVTQRLMDREGPALSDRRLGVVEEYFDVRLAAGQHDRIMAEVREAAEENPLRERVQAQLMLALHQAGRTTEGLEVYAATRSRLVARLGVEPGPLLRETQSRLLRDEDRTASAPTVSSSVPVPRQLPAPVSVFAGRSVELARLDALLPVGGDPSAPVVVIGGGAGTGKTTLAVHWAHRVRERFPDGQLYVNLRGFDPSGNNRTPDDVVRGFLSALNLPQAQIPVSDDEAFGLYRSLVADKRILVVLDNARDVEQVRPLLPGSPGCLTVVTSRDQLPGLIATEGAVPVVLGLLPEDEAREMLVRRLGAARVEAEPEAVDQIATLCARLPLALAIVAARAVTNQDFSLAVLAEELGMARGGLDAFDAGDSATSVRSVFSWSYRTLTEQAARLFRLLALHPGPRITPVGAASLLGVPVRQGRSLLVELARAHLIAEPSPGRYGFHDLLRAYATEFVHTSDSEDVRHEAVHRMLDHYLHTAALAVRILRPQQAVPVVLDPIRDGVTVAEVRTEPAAAAWFAAEHTALHALVELAARSGFDAFTYRLADTLTSTLWYGGARWLGGPSLYQTALAAARRLGDPLGLALSHRAFAVLHLTHDRLDDAEAQLVAALGFAEEIGDLGLQADIHQGIAKVNEGMRRHVVQREHTEIALDLFRAVGNQIGVANSYNNLAWCLTELGDYERAVTLCKQAFELFEDFPDRKSEANTWDTLGYASRHLGHHEEAVACYRRALELHRQINSRVPEAHAYRKIGDIRYDRGAFDEARVEWRRAMDIFSELGLPGGVKEIRERLTRLAEQ
jgi:DNA-binding SARP family transcriptional activator/tetratricopeptide (TPR) repeat protein